MKTKQLIGIIVTGVVIIAVGVTGIVSNVVSKKLLAESEEKSNAVFRQIFDGVTSGVELPDEEFIGVLNIVGEIGASGGSSYFRSGSAYNHELYMKYVDEMEKSDLNKGIFLYVNSPGGSVYESDELYQKLMEYKEVTKRPIWAYFASQACSGGYYISMAADEIQANRNTWTGSIGVIISLTNVKGLYDKLGIKEIDITSGKNKAMGSMGLDLTEEQEGILQSLVDEAYDQFVGIVAEGRNMSESEVRTLADGRIYSGNQAVQNGLVDAIANVEDTKAAFIEKLECDKDILFYEPENDVGDFFNSLFGKVEELLPKSETDLADDIMNHQGNGVLKYYAK
ncbi:MAG: signal peptide peptidase SppA [Lachnospiraceae bacterium]|nr:signal peptide peptidase SppA [Lachnospiraceae bacterium]